MRDALDAVLPDRLVELRVDADVFGALFCGSGGDLLVFVGGREREGREKRGEGILARGDEF